MDSSKKLVFAVRSSASEPQRRCLPPLPPIPSMSGNCCDGGWMKSISASRRGSRPGEGNRIETIEEIARGRVWTGRQALSLGLIDEIGDFEAAVRRAKELAEIPLDADIPVMMMRSTKAGVWPSLPPAAWEQALRSLRQLVLEHALVLMPPETWL